MVLAREPHGRRGLGVELLLVQVRSTRSAVDVLMVTMPTTGRLLWLRVGVEGFLFALREALLTLHGRRV